MRWLLGSGLLLLLTFAVYLPIYTPIYPHHSVAGYIWDDDELLVNNPSIRSLHGLRQSWFDPANHGRFYPDYYPLTYTSWRLEYRIAGIAPQLNHFDNVLLHALNAILLWVILTRLGIPGAALAAAIFAVHPVQVESVAWVSERKNVLSGFFFLLSAWTCIEAWGLPSPSGCGWRVFPPGEGVEDVGTFKTESLSSSSAKSQNGLDSHALTRREYTPPSPGANVAIPGSQVGHALTRREYTPPSPGGRGGAYPPCLFYLCFFTSWPCSPSP